MLMGSSPRPELICRRINVSFYTAKVCFDTFNEENSSFVQYRFVQYSLVLQITKVSNDSRMQGIG
jgi:hypothetical protein